MEYFPKWCTVLPGLVHKIFTYMILFALVFSLILSSQTFKPQAEDGRAKDGRAKDGRSKSAWINAWRRRTSIRKRTSIGFEPLYTCGIICYSSSHYSLTHRPSLCDLIIKSTNIYWAYTKCWALCKARGDTTGAERTGRGSAHMGVVMWDRIKEWANRDVATCGRLEILREITLVLWYSTASQKSLIA